jgi:hypothetical protein
MNFNFQAQHGSVSQQVSSISLSSDINMVDFRQSEHALHHSYFINKEVFLFSLLYEAKKNIYIMMNIQKMYIIIYTINTDTQV